MSPEKLFVMLLIMLVTAFAIIPSPAICQYGSQSLFTDHRARQIGDIVTILVVEYSSAKSEANSKNTKNTERGAVVTGGGRTQAYMPMFGLKGQMKNSYDNDAETSRKGSLTGKITATITDITANGNLIIKGERQVIVNGENEKMTVSGVIRPEDIRSDNTILSVNIGDAQISYQGKGMVEKGQKPGFITRFLGWLF